jgi:hypothetical protein
VQQAGPDRFWVGGPQAIATLHATSLLPAAALVALRYRFADELRDVEGVLGRARGG